LLVFANLFGLAAKREKRLMIYYLIFDIIVGIISFAFGRTWQQHTDRDYYRTLTARHQLALEHKEEEMLNTQKGFAAEIASLNKQIALLRIKLDAAETRADEFQDDVNNLVTATVIQSMADRVAQLNDSDNYIRPLTPDVQGENA
jgi:hypothetical protein